MLVPQLSPKEPIPAYWRIKHKLSLSGNKVSGLQTLFNGDLTGAGMRIFIVNSSGIVFGSTATVNVAQLVASGLTMANQDFLDFTDGTITKMKFQGGLGTVTNEGTINATDGVALFGQKVLNTGTIVAENGFVVMATGDRVLLGEPGSKIIVEMSSATGGEPGAGDLVGFDPGDVC